VKRHALVNPQEYSANQVRESRGSLVARPRQSEVNVTLTLPLPVYDAPASASHA